MLMLKTCGIVKLTILPALRSSQTLRQAYPSLAFRNIYQIKNLKDAGSRLPDGEVPQQAQLLTQTKPKASQGLIFESAVDMHNRLESEQKLYFFIAIGFLMTFNVVARIMLKSYKAKDIPKHGR